MGMQLLRDWAQSLVTGKDAAEMRAPAQDLLGNDAFYFHATRVLQDLSLKNLRRLRRPSGVQLHVWLP